MKNLQIGDNDLIGKRFNGHDLHIYLRQRGIDSSHIVWNKQSDDKHTFVLSGDDPNRNINNQMLAGLERVFGLHSVLLPYSYSLLNSKQFLEADVVHYHLIHNYFFNISLLPILTKLKPTVWTLHDPWALTGHCIHPFDCQRWKTGCGDCGDLNTPFAINKDTSALYWEIKRDLYRQMDVDIIVSSRWMQNMVEQSPLVSNFKVHRIPFGLDLDKYSPGNAAEAKCRLGIPQNNLVVCFRAQSNPFKGMESVKQCLRQLKTDAPVTLLAVAKDTSLEEFLPRFQIIDFEFVTDDSIMTDAYNASDVLLMPSAAESFGMMAMEAMAFGKPVIVYDGTPLSETIFAPEGGIAVPQGDVDALTCELESLLDNPERRLALGRRARKLAEQHYDVEKYVSKIDEVYKEVIARRTIGEREKYIISQLKKIAQDTPRWQYVLPDSSLKAKIKGKLRKVPLLRPIYHNIYKPAKKLAGKIVRKVAL